MRALVFPMLVALAVALPGCASSNASGKWPSLEPRPGEIAPLVPRTPLGACANCGADVFAAPSVPAPPALPQPAPADAATRMDAVAKVLTSIEADYPAQLAMTQKAVAAARAGGDEIDAEVQRSRLEAVFIPLAAQGQILDGVSDDLIGKADTVALAAQLAALRARIAKLAAVRAAAGV